MAVIVACLCFENIGRKKNFGENVDVTIQCIVYAMVLYNVYAMVLHNVYHNCKVMFPCSFIFIHI